MYPVPLRLALAALLAAAAAPATAGDARFAEVAARASRLDSLGPFLERYIGSCAEGAERAECESNVRAQRRGLEHRIYAATVAEQTLDVVRVERQAHGYRFLVTPFLDGGGLALTHGQPSRQDAGGRPLIGLLVLDGALPPGMDADALESALRTGRLELEVVFRPEGTWKLKRKREPGYYQGVKARFLALRLVDSRSGEEIVSRVF